VITGFSKIYKNKTLYLCWAKPMNLQFSALGCSRLDLDEARIEIRRGRTHLPTANGYIGFGRKLFYAWWPDRLDRSIWGSLVEPSNRSSVPFPQFNRLLFRIEAEWIVGTLASQCDSCPIPGGTDQTIRTPRVSAPNSTAECLPESAPERSTRCR
jgi:hypothetical protein